MPRDDDDASQVRKAPGPSSGAVAGALGVAMAGVTVAAVAALWLPGTDEFRRSWAALAVCLAAPLTAVTGLALGFLGRASAAGKGALAASAVALLALGAFVATHLTGWGR